MFKCSWLGSKAALFYVYVQAASFYVHAWECEFLHTNSFQSGKQFLSVEHVNYSGRDLWLWGDFDLEWQNPVWGLLWELSHSLFESLCLSPTLLSASLPVLLWVGMGSKLWDPVRHLSLGSKTPFKWRQWWRNSLHDDFSADNGRIYIERDTKRMQVLSCVRPLFCPNRIFIFCSSWNLKMWLFAAVILKSQQAFQMNCTDYYRPIRKVE